jgi:two-component system response regulator DesR
MSLVLIVEDHPLVAEATGKLLAGLDADITPVLCSDATQAVARLSESPEAWFRIFLDLDVPGAYGLSLAKEVKRRGLAERCCVVSAFERRDYIDEVQRSGFLGYIVKAAPIAEFQIAVREVLDGRSAFPPLKPSTRPSAVRLTRRQVQLLDLIRLGLSSKEIALSLHIAEGTVNNHVASILQIFDAASRAQAVSRAIELGLIATAAPYKDPNADLVPCPAKRPWEADR